MASWNISALSLLAKHRVRRLRLFVDSIDCLDLHLLGHCIIELAMAHHSFPLGLRIVGLLRC